MATGVPAQEGYSLEITVNSYGIVYPPPPIVCRGVDCKYALTEAGCRTRRHHLHPGAPEYVKHSKLAEKFRELRLLSVWMQECVHDELHDRNPFAVEPPGDEIMSQGIREDKILKAIGLNASNGRQIKAAQQTEVSLIAKKRLNRAFSNLLELQVGLLEKIDEIEVVPEQLVTGFLLMTNPTLARRRIFEGTGFALTASSKNFNPEIYNPVDDFIIGGILHQGRAVGLRPKTIPFKGHRADSQMAKNETSLWAPSPAPATA